MSTNDTVLHPANEAAGLEAEQPGEKENAGNLSCAPSVMNCAEATAKIAYVEHDVCTEDTKVTPVVRVVNVEALPEERVRRAIRTILASTRGVLVGEISTGDLNEVAHVLSTCLA